MPKWVYQVVCATIGGLVGGLVAYTLLCLMRYVFR